MEQEPFSPEKGVQILKLQPDDWQELRNLKLRSLGEEPVAFEDPDEGRAKYESRTKEEWRAILEGKMSGGRDGETEVVFAKDERVFVGMLSAIIPGGQDPAVKCAIIQHMYVSKGVRGKGIGRDLFQSLLERLKARGDLTRLELDVVASQIPAIELYKSFGFVEIGRKKDAVNRDGNVYDEIEMELKLS